MEEVNSYQSPDIDPQRPVIAPQPHFRKRWAITGLIVGTAIPVALGAYELHRAATYHVSLPPGTAACGMSALGAIMLIVVIGPIFGLIGAVCGRIASGTIRGRDES